MLIETIVEIVLLLVLAGICGLAVFHPRFDDTLLQRVALGGICLGCLGMAYWMLDARDPPRALRWCIWFGAIFALETGRKIQAKVRKGTFRPAEGASVSHKGVP